MASRSPGLADAYGGMEEFEAYVASTAEVLHAVRERLRPIEPGEEIATGVHGVDSPGHTAGHMAVLVESEGERLLLAGDAITNVHVAGYHFPFPGVGHVFRDGGGYRWLPSVVG